MIPEQIETATSVTIIPFGYRTRCSESGCRNLGRVILRHADAGGRPIDNAEFCLRHGRARIKSYGLRGSGFTTIACVTVWVDRDGKTRWPKKCSARWG